MPVRQVRGLPGAGGAGRVSVGFAHRNDAPLWSPPTSRARSGSPSTSWLRPSRSPTRGSRPDCQPPAGIVRPRRTKTRDPDRQITQLSKLAQWRNSPPPDAEHASQTCRLDGVRMTRVITLLYKSGRAPRKPSPSTTSAPRLKRPDPLQRRHQGDRDYDPVQIATLPHRPFNTPGPWLDDFVRQQSIVVVRRQH